MFNDIWSEMPYVLSTVWWWVILPVLLIAIPWVIFLSLHEQCSDWDTKAWVSCTTAILVTSIVVCGYIAACVAYDANHRYNGQHEWRGGAGPKTYCIYEIRHELVGVIGKGGHYEDHTYTVCRDSE